jgi:hypothetical protein
MSRVQEAAATTLQAWIRTILARKELAELRYLQVVNADDLTKESGYGRIVGSAGLLKSAKQLLVLGATVALLGLSLLVRMDDPKVDFSSGSNVMALSASREPHGYTGALSIGKGVAKVVSGSLPTIWIEPRKI